MFYDVKYVIALSLKAFPRAMTEPIANAINFITDTDGEWTRQLIEDFAEIDDKGPDGEVPVQPAYAQDKYFWIIGGLGLVLGGVIGLFDLGFMNIIDEARMITLPAGVGISNVCLNMCRLPRDGWIMANSTVWTTADIMAERY